MKVRFATADGVREEQGRAGERLLDVAQRAGMPLEGTCGGDLACATCHVVVAAEDAVRLPPASEEEEDMLDLVPDARRTSRLSCQIRLSEAIGNLTVSLP
ncbi:2Fe-2S iron-sulfur cluster-binding protein [Sphingomonas adhaesiva]|uniref:2Fe-2S iron-sulfur cluster-binding protein n=1 Tax=Sphingomonas adhaesiva TaxID=28212 RepID=UPI002FFB5C7A